MVSNTPTPKATHFCWPISRRQPVNATGFLDEGYHRGVMGPNGQWAMKPGFWHTGIDLNAAGTSGDGDRGRPVYAVADGLVEYVGTGLAGWNTVIVLRVILSDGSVEWWRYGHCQAITAKPGQTVRCGQQIAEIGKPNASQYAHVHLDRLYKKPLQGWAWWPHQNGPQSEVTQYCSDPDALLRARGAAEPA